MGTTQNTLPSFDEALAQPPAQSAPGQLPTFDEALSTSQPSAFSLFHASHIGLFASQDDIIKANEAQKQFLKTTGVGRIMTATGHGFDEAFGSEQVGLSPENKQALAKAGVLPDYEKGQGTLLQHINEALILPAAAALNTAWRLPGGVIGAVESGLTQTGEETGFPQIGKGLAEQVEFGAQGAPGMDLFAHGPSGVPKVVADGSRAKVFDGEAQYMGLKESTPEQDAARVPQLREQAEAGAINLQKGQEALTEPKAPFTPEPQTIHDVVRQDNPQLFSEYDALKTRADSYSQTFQELIAQHREEAEASAPHNEEITALQEKMEDASARKAKIYQEKIDDLKDKNQAYVEDRMDPKHFSNDINNIRSELAPITQRIGDLAPDVRKAYQDAGAKIPPEAPATVQEVREPSPIAPEPEEAPAPETTPEQTDKIADTISKSLEAAGRPKEEAQASAQVAASFYKTLADTYGGKHGTAEDWLAREGSAVKAGGEGKTTRGSYSPATDTAKATIRLMKSANASTFIHETGHHFLSVMDRYASKADVPQALKDDYATVRKWLGLKDGDNLFEKNAKGRFTFEKQQEQFAKGFENYVREGVAPSKQLAGVFAKFKEWLTNIYQSAQKLNTPITDEIRGVFDRLLAHEPEKTVIAPEKERAEPTPIAPEPVASPVSDEPIGAAPAGAKPEAKPAAPEKPKPEGQVAEPGLKGSFIKADGKLDTDALNYALYNNTPDWLQKYFNEYDERNRSTYGNAASEVETLESVQKLVDASGWTPAEIRGMEIGQKKNRMQQLASADLFKQMVGAVREKAASAAASGDPKKIAEFWESTQEHGLLMQAFRDQKAYAAEASRNLGIRRAIKAATADAEQFAELFQKITDKSPKDVTKQAEMLNKLTNPGGAEKFLKDGAQTPWQKFKNGMLEYYINALISGPVTHLRYSLGNALNAMWTPLFEIPAAAVIGRTREIISGERNTDRVYLGEAGAQLHGLLKGSRDGLTAAAEAFRNNLSPALPGEAVPKQVVEGQKIGSAIPGVAGKVINLPSRSVSAIHSFFKSLRYEQNIQGMAYRQAMKEGLEGDAFTNRVSDLTTTPTPGMMKDATVNSLKELYMSPSEYSGFMGTLVRATNKSMLAKIIVPFMKIGTQITRNAFIERTPLGLASTEVRENAFYQHGGAAGDTQLAKMTTGVALMGTLSLMVAEGLATGDGPTNPDQRAIWLLNHKPNSMTIGGVTVPYQGLGHLGMLMRFAANMTETARGWDEKGGDHLAHNFLESLTRSVLDENFMRGVKDMTDAVYHPDEYGEKWLQDFATNWLPFSVGMSQVARLVDPVHRVAHDITDAAWSKIPVLSKGLYPQRDRFGEPINNSTTLQNYASDPTVQRMEALHQGIGRLERKIRGVQLSDGEYDEYSKIAGRLTKMRLDAAVGVPGFDQAPQGVQIQIIHKIVESSRESARKLVMMQNPEVIHKATQAKVDALTGKTP